MHPLRPDRGGGAGPSARATPRRRRRRRPDRPVYPAVDVPMAKIMAERPLIEAVLSRFGVPSSDLADVMQEVYLGAYRSLLARRYRPPTHLPRRSALIRWLTGIAWRHALKYRESAQRRLVPAGLRLVIAAPGPIDQILAREALGALRTLRPQYQQVLGYVALGMSQSAISARMSIPGPTVSTWIRMGRLALKAALARTST